MLAPVFPMTHSIGIALLAGIAVHLCPTTAHGIDCDATKLATHTDDAKTTIWAPAHGPTSLFFFSNLDVNTDGSSRSYHPDDPNGRSKALNNIANATSSIRDADGNDLDCSPRQGKCYELYITTFEKARNAQWATSGVPQWRSDDMIPWAKNASGASVPCTIPEGPFKGYFVSETSFAVDPSQPDCSQLRYLDSLVFQAIVLPAGTAWASSAKDGDLAVVKDLGSGVTAFAIVGDRGPSDEIGEGTIALAATLGKATLNGSETYTQIRKLVRADVVTLVLNGNNIRDKEKGALTQALIDQNVKAAFDQWGGEDRLAACIAARHP